MKVWHVNVGNFVGAIDGVAVMSTRLARVQARLGHDVTLWVAAGEEHRAELRAAVGPAVGLGLFPGGREALRAARAALRDADRAPDVVHLHSVFRPVHAVLAVEARRRGIPVVQTTHAGLSPVLLGRDRFRKEAYRWLVERWVLRSASAVVALQHLEADDIRRFSGRRAPIEVIANAVDPAAVAVPGWALTPGEPPVALLLSRYDVGQNDLDRVVELASWLPEVTFRIHGTQDENEPARTTALRVSAPANVEFLPPVFGAAKQRALLRASFFLQPSRAEGISLALMEAMASGVPCAVSQFVGRSLRLGESEAALVLDDDPMHAAGQLEALLHDRRWQATLSDNATAFAATHFDPVVVAEAHLALYRRLLARDHQTHPAPEASTAA